MNDTCTNATTNGAIEMPDLTFDALIELHEKVANMPPVITAFYFIDRAKEHFEFLSFLRTVPDVFKASSIFGPATLPVFNVPAYEITNDWPPVKEPGVWAVMSDGNHREMMLGKTAGELIK